MGPDRINRRARRALQAAAIVVLVTGLCGGLLTVGAFEDVSRSLNDRLYPTGDVAPQIAVVTLPAEAAGGWTRTQHADVLRAIDRAGAVAVGYDVVFERTGDGDDDLIAALGELRRPDGSPRVALAATSETLVRPGDLPVYRSEVEPNPRFVLLDETEDGRPVRIADVGNAAIFPGPDGVVRHVPLIAEDAEDLGISSSLALAVVAIATRPSGAGEAIRYRLGDDPVAMLPTGEAVPADDLFRLEVNWAIPVDPGERPPGFAHDHRDVLAGTVDLRNRLVFVGVVDSLADFEEVRGGFDTLPTPIDKEATAGVFIHANAANTILTQTYRRDAPGEAIGAMALFSALLCAVGLGLRPRLRPTIAMFAVGVLAVVAWIGWWVPLRFSAGVNLDQLWPSLAVVLAMAGVAAARYSQEDRERRRIAELFRQYVPDAVADELIASEDLVALAEGRRTEVTVLFCDLRGFTATAARLEPKDVRAMLEVYYDVSTRIIQAHGGTVMQYVGDEVYAVFGAPLDQPDHAQRALDAAIAMQRGAEEINGVLAERDVQIAYGIGLNTGPVVAGIVGSQIHRMYMAVGQTVNVGARLCSQAVPGGIVLSKWTRDALTTVPELDPLGPVSLKGVADDPEPAAVVL